MVGGDEAAFAKGLPILQAMGKNIFHAGGPGAGQAVKICNNMMLAINMIGVAEGFILGRKLGLDWDKLHAICVCCGAPATRNQRLIDGKPARYDSPQVMVGGADSYEARCRSCHIVGRDDGAQARLF